jgi:hypothetical protein
MVDSTPVALSFTTELYDSNAFHSPTTNPDKFYAPVDGFYHFMFYFKIANGRGKIWNAYITGSRDTSPYHDGPPTYGVSNSGPVGDGLIHAECIDWMGWMAAGEWIGVTLTQHAAGGGTVSASVSYRASIKNVSKNVCKTICKVFGLHWNTGDLPANTDVTLEWELEEIDTSSMWTDDTHQHAQRITIPATGWYQIYVGWFDHYDNVNPDIYSAGVWAKIMKNGSTELLFGRAVYWRQPAFYAVEVSLTAGDYITIVLNNKRTSGTSQRNVWLDSDGYKANPYFMVRRIDE